MDESKIDLTDRLRRERRWEEASKYKDSTAKQLRDGGMKRSEAIEEAWLKMAEKYPPLVAPQEAEFDQDEDMKFEAEQIASLPSGNLEGFYADVGWCYGNLERGEVDPATAPSSGALALLKWARRNKNDFFAKIVPRAIAAPNTQREEKAVADAEHRRIDRLADMLGAKKPKRLEDVLGIKKPKQHKD